MAYDDQADWVPGQREGMAAMSLDGDRQRKWLGGVEIANAMVATGGCEVMTLRLWADGTVTVDWTPLDPAEGEEEITVRCSDAELVLAKGAPAVKWVAERVGELAAFVASLK
jgi:hypothetical protein